MGLNESNSNVRGQILLHGPMPVQQKHKRKNKNL